MKVKVTFQEGETILRSLNCIVFTILYDKEKDRQSALQTVRYDIVLVTVNI